MTIPTKLLHGLKVPVVVAPMLLISNPALVIAACKAGAIGTFPALNQRTTQGFEAWIDEIEAALGPDDAAYGVNLIVSPANTRLKDDLEVVVRRRVPLVITSFGADNQVVDAVHAYGGIVFHDIASARHAAKALRPFPTEVAPTTAALLMPTPPPEGAESANRRASSAPPPLSPCLRAIST